MQRVLPTPHESDCYLLQLVISTKGQRRYSTGTALRQSLHLSTKSRLNVKLKLNTIARMFWNWVYNDPSRSSKVNDLAPVESTHRNSYWSLIVTLVLACRISEILEHLHAAEPLFLYPTHIPAKISGCSLAVDPWCWVQAN